MKRQRRSTKGPSFSLSGKRRILTFARTGRANDQWSAVMNTRTPMTGSRRGFAKRQQHDGMATTWSC